MKCRFCGEPLAHVFIDLLHAPPSNAFLTREQLDEPETYYPLKLYVCHACFLVQIEEYKKAGEIFDAGYVYHSSFSSTWLDHARRYALMMIGRFGYGPNSRVVEIASNDGYLLQYFKEKCIPVLGIEPSAGTAAEAEKKGIETRIDFFGRRLALELARQGWQADLLIGNNVLAHVPDLNDFVAGLKIALKPDGVITLEFPHLMQLIDHCQFDSIYHEHFSYLSFLTVRDVFRRHGLALFDVEEIPTHGGSLRIFAHHAEDRARETSAHVQALEEKERSRGMRDPAFYLGFQQNAERVRYQLLRFLLRQKAGAKKVAAYGAAAKGNTLFNFCGVRTDLVAFVVDASPFKQGKFLPGSHIPVVTEAELRAYRPDYVLVLPWNLRDEIMAQLDYIRAWGGRFVIPIPQVEVLA
ncbi:MAG: methyltransferase domain-containing protein [Acidobacteria bacterium]|nr:methyltransferase domain-containing protein [Acidobacteriota bacterium]